MVGIILGAVIVGYTIIIIIKRGKDLKEGKSCCSGCSSCPSQGGCHKVHGQ